MKEYESIVSEALLAHFPNPMGKTLMNNAQNTCNIEATLSVAAVFWPRIIEDDGHIFIADFYAPPGIPPRLEVLKAQFNNRKQKIERWVNAWSLAEFFLLAYTPPVEDPQLLESFGETLRFFWSLRLQTLFADREFIIEIGEAIEGENGLCITLYEKEPE